VVGSADEFLDFLGGSWDLKPPTLALIGFICHWISKDFQGFPRVSQKPDFGI